MRYVLRRVCRSLGDPGKIPEPDRETKERPLTSLSGRCPVGRPNGRFTLPMIDDPDGRHPAYLIERPSCYKDRDELIATKGG
jgi:hypothetical protein